MVYPKRQLIVTWLAAMLAGCVLHFLYQWWPNAVTALFSPVNESQRGRLHFPDAL